MSIHGMRDRKAREPSAKVDPGDVVVEERQRSKRRAAGEGAVDIVEMRVHHRAWVRDQKREVGQGFGRSWRTKDSSTKGVQHALEEPVFVVDRRVQVLDDEPGSTLPDPLQAAHELVKL